MTTFARIGLAMLALTIAASAQPKPSFSGRWVIVSPKEGAGQEQIVKQDDKTLSTEYVLKAGGHKMVYQLDGVERRMAPLSGGTDITMLAKASWDAGRIVISSTMSYPNGMRTQAREIWSIDAQGRLVIESTETGPGGTPGPSMKVIYVKKQ